MRLDVRRGAVGRTAAFDHVGIERPLSKESHGAAGFALNAQRFVLENVDENVTDELALFLWVSDTG